MRVRGRGSAHCKVAILVGWRLPYTGVVLWTASAFVNYLGRPARISGCKCLDVVKSEYLLVCAPAVRCTRGASRNFSSSTCDTTVPLAWN